MADNQLYSPESQVSKEAEKEIGNFKGQDVLKDETPAADSEIPSATLVEDEKVVSVPDRNATVTTSTSQSAASSLKESTTTGLTFSLLLFLVS